MMTFQVFVEVGVYGSFVLIVGDVEVIVWTA